MNATKLSGYQIAILLIVCIVGIAVIGALALVFFPEVIDSPVPTVVEAIVLPSNTPSPTIVKTHVIQRTLPPTWTPTVVEEAELATVAPNDTSTPNATAAFVLMSQPKTFKGSGNRALRNLVFPAGTLKITWTYSGLPGTAAKIDKLKYNHQDQLAMLDLYYQFDKQYYENLLKMDKAYGDTKQYDIDSKAYKQRTKKYNQDVANENASYQKSMAELGGSIKIVFNRASVNKPRTIALNNLPSSNTVYATIEQGSDFYFEVSAVGQWQIDIVPQ